MRLIGITGSIACGKSTVSRELSRRGYAVIDGDALSRELTGPGGAAMPEIRSVFGNRFVLQDGSLNRREMGSLVFSDPLARERLDRVMAPYLKALTSERIEAVRSSGALLCFLDFPLLYEKGYDRYCDTVWCVWLPEDLQLRRLMDRDGYSREEALNRMNAVMSSDEKANRSPVVIDNSGHVEDTLQQVEDQLNIELSRTGAGPRRRRSAVQESASVSVQPVPPSFSSSQNIPYDGIERSELSRKKPSARKASWQMPAPFRTVLVCLAVILAVSFTAQMLMDAYLSRQRQTHEEEQRAIDRAYPLMYENLIRSVSAEYNLSPSLIAAVILNESSFRPGIESPVGARGLMQLMPDTAEWIAHKLRMDKYHFDQLLDPETNIRFGCWYLNYLSTLFNGDPLCVVCAYHAGQGEIASWLSNPMYSSDGRTLNRDSLPEGPTKIYAGRVTRDYGIYKAKYFDQTDLIPSSGSHAAAD
ncbi:MAG: dephospho-CoA kinase [Clostridiales bacterium]|nr:dephospho-CoA kinase [Clostridiales bacterium]